MEGRLAEAAAVYDSALALLDAYPCPLVEWKVVSAGGHVGAKAGDAGRARRLEARLAQLIELVAEAIEDETLRRRFAAPLRAQPAPLWGGDERFNGGGLVAEYIIDYLRRPLLSYWTTRWGEDFTTPLNIFGPKAMIVNEFAGSGGDALPWMFKQAKIGPVVGKRTWGGLVGIFGFPPLMDGGGVTAPNLAFWNPFSREWEVANAGVPPDYDVDYEPAAVKAGRDPQLEKAVELVMAELKKNPPPRYQRPAYPNYHRTGTFARPSAAAAAGR